MQASRQPQVVQKCTRSREEERDIQRALVDFMQDYEIYQDMVRDREEADARGEREVDLEVAQKALGHGHSEDEVFRSLRATSTAAAGEDDPASYLDKQIEEAQQRIKEERVLDDENDDFSGPRGP